MATFKFYLKNPENTKNSIQKHGRIPISQQKEVPIRLHVNYFRKKVKVYIRENIKSDHWDSAEQRVVRNPDKSELNARLRIIKRNAEEVFRRYKNDHNQEDPPQAELKRLIEVAIGNRVDTTITNFFDYYDEFISRKKQEYFYNRKIKEASIREQTAFRDSAIPGYIRSRDILKDFSKTYRVDFDTFTDSFRSRYLKYLAEKWDFEQNTISRHFKLLRAVLNSAQREGYKIPIAYKSWKIKTSETVFIYLNETELEVLADLQLKDYHSRIRDLFLVGCWTGLRFSDFSRLTYENIDLETETIRIKTQKTSADVVIPILPEILTIFKKYKDDGLPKYQNQVMNRELKNVGKVLEIKLTELKLTTSIGNKDYSKLTSHAARRSFASNMYYRGIPVEEIMPITGHRTEREFRKYIRVSGEDKAEKFRASAIRNAGVKHLKIS